MSDRVPLGELSSNCELPQRPTESSNRRGADIKAFNNLDALNDKQTTSGRRRPRKADAERNEEIIRVKKARRLSHTQKRNLRCSIESDEIITFLDQTFKKQARPFQVETAKSIYDGKSTFVIAGTGSGKSLAYWSLLVRDKAIILVVCPLNRLMQEQVLSLLHDPYFQSVSEHGLPH